MIVPLKRDSVDIFGRANCVIKPRGGEFPHLPLPGACGPGSPLPGPLAGAPLGNLGRAFTKANLGPKGPHCVGLSKGLEEPSPTSGKELTIPLPVPNHPFPANPKFAWARPIPGGGPRRNGVWEFNPLGGPDRIGPDGP